MYVCKRTSRQKEENKNSTQCIIIIINIISLPSVVNIPRVKSYEKSKNKIVGWLKIGHYYYYYYYIINDKNSQP